jgi:short-subunit dehydrogenase
VPAGEALRVFITGASSGLGAALAAHYATGGAQLGLAARRGELLEALAAGLPGKHRRYALDVSDAPALARAAADFIAGAGVPHIVIANAGISVGTLSEYPEDLAAFRRVLEVNVLGMAATFQPFVAPLRAARRGSLVGIASVAGIRGLPGAGAYSASKAAAICYLESLRVELRGSGVRVMTIVPGYIKTPMTAVNPYPMPFLLNPDDAARRIARLIASGRSYGALPWQMAIVAKLLRLLPNPLFDRLFSRVGRKPRGLPL